MRVPPDQPQRASPHTTQPLVSPCPGLPPPPEAPPAHPPPNPPQQGSRHPPREPCACVLIPGLVGMHVCKASRVINATLERLRQHKHTHIHIHIHTYTRTRTCASARGTHTHQSNHPQTHLQGQWPAVLDRGFHKEAEFDAANARPQTAFTPQPLLDLWCTVE